MYRRRYLSLHETVQVIADHLAKADPRSYSDAASAFDAACGQLAQALYDGVVHSEGVFWQPMPPDNSEPPPVLPPKLGPIDERFWANRTYHSITSEDGEKHSSLDIVTVYWSADCLNFEDFGIPCVYKEVRVLSTDIDREFLAIEPTPQEKLLAEGHSPSAVTEPIVRTGVAGRPTSKHLIEEQIKRRAAKGLLCGSLAAEARALLEWLRTEHPLAPRMTPKTAENAIRDIYKTLKREMQT